MNRNSKGWGNGYANTNYAGSGLLSNNHLQNLDRELKLIRQKRELIKREQQMFTVESDFDRKRQYDEQTNHNASNMYDNTWQTPPLKRANIRAQINPWMSSSQDSLKLDNYNSFSKKYIPSLLSKKIDPPLFPIAQKQTVQPTQKNTVTSRLSRPTNVRKDIRLTKVTKKKSKNPPNKLNSYPVEERKNLVSKATGSQPAKAKPAKLPLDPEAMTLREDRVPNKHITGRLELALGSLVKEIRCSNCHNETFKTLITHPANRRTMKQAVRERIRSVMINKTVGSVDDIINQYRKKFSSDKDIVELVINSQHPKLVTVIDTENPEEFFKKNITAILEKKVQEMSSNLLKMYLNARNKNTLAYTKAAKEANSTVDEPVVRLSESTINNEMTMKVLRGITGKYVTIEENNVLTRYYTDLIEEILEEKLPEHLEQCTAVFRKIFQIDQQFKTIKFMVTKQIKDELKAKYANIDTETDNKDTLNTETSEDIETQQKVITKAVTVTENNATQEEMPPKNDTQNVLLTENVTVTPQSCDAINPIAKKTESSSTTFKSPITVCTPLPVELSYYVKLIGRPKLPNRAVICDFLNNYRPNSIKKHKSINNLLVIGFINKENYDKILAANGTIFGDITFLIKPSEKIYPAKGGRKEVKANDKVEQELKDSNGISKETTSKSVDEEQKQKDANGISKETTSKSVDEEQKQKKDSNRISKETTNRSVDEEQDEKDFIGKELDDQISDLLSTIRETDGRNKE